MQDGYLYLNALAAGWLRQTVAREVLVETEIPGDVGGGGGGTEIPGDGIGKGPTSQEME